MTYFFFNIHIKKRQDKKKIRYNFFSSLMLSLVVFMVNTNFSTHNASGLGYMNEKLHNKNITQRKFSMTHI